MLRKRKKINQSDQCMKKIKTTNQIRAWDNWLNKTWQLSLKILNPPTLVVSVRQRWEPAKTFVSNDPSVCGHWLMSTFSRSISSPLVPLQIKTKTKKQHKNDDKNILRNAKFKVLYKHWFKTYLSIYLCIYLSIYHDYSINMGNFVI